MRPCPIWPLYPLRPGARRRTFSAFPWTLYRDDPNWVPPLRGNQKELVGYRPHPFYERNAVQTFLAYRSGKVCGRIAAILNRGHIERYGERRGFFGFFECVDDQEVANGLFDAARDWFAERDIFCLRGPANPSLNYELGLLVDGFDLSPTFMMTYNPPYYAGLIEGYGFRKTQDLYSFWGHIDMLPKIRERLAPIADADHRAPGAEDPHVEPGAIPAGRDGLPGHLQPVAGQHVGLRADVGRRVAPHGRGLRYLIVPELALAAELDGKMIGAAFGLPDYNPRIREIDGRLFPLGFLRLLRRKQDIKKIRLISTNVLPEYQRLGVGLVLMSSLVPMAWKWGLAGGGVLLGAGVEQALPRQPRKRRRADRQDLPHVRLGPRAGLPRSRRTTRS